MEEKEASATSNSASPGRKAYVLGVVNASEIKCKVDRKRRWDQRPDASDDDGPLCKLPCDSSSDAKDPLMENNFRHEDDSLISNDVAESVPSPTVDDRLSSPPSPTQPILVKEQIFVQAPSDVLNTLDLNSSFPNTLAGSFNEFNYTEGNQRVTIEIGTVAVTPSSLDDELKTSVEIVDPNSSSMDSLQTKDNDEPETMENEINTVIECQVEDVSSPPDLEGGYTVDSAIIDAESAGRVDPDVMAVIIGISPSTNVSLTQHIESRQEAEEDSDSNDKINDSLLIDEKPNTSDEYSEKHDEIKVKNQTVSDKNAKNEAQLTKIGVKLKALVDYDDYSDESSQQSDKVTQVEPIVKSCVEEVSTICENSLDSKEEEFHDCLEQQTTDESNYDSSSLNNVVPTPQELDNPASNYPATDDTSKLLPIVNETLVDDIVSTDDKLATSSFDSKINEGESIDKSSPKENAISEAESAASVKLSLDDDICDNRVNEDSAKLNDTSSTGSNIKNTSMDLDSDLVSTPLKVEEVIMKAGDSKLLRSTADPIIPLVQQKDVKTGSRLKTKEDSLSLVLEVTSHQTIPSQNKSESSVSEVACKEQVEPVALPVEAVKGMDTSSAKVQVYQETKIVSAKLQEIEGTQENLISLLNPVTGSKSEELSSIVEITKNELISDTQDPNKRLDEHINRIDKPSAANTGVQISAGNNDKLIELHESEVTLPVCSETSTTCDSPTVSTDSVDEFKHKDSIACVENKISNISSDLKTLEMEPNAAETNQRQAISTVTVKPSISQDLTDSAIGIGDVITKANPLQVIKESEVSPHIVEKSKTNEKDNSQFARDSTEGISGINIVPDNNCSILTAKKLDSKGKITIGSDKDELLIKTEIVKEVPEESLSILATKTAADVEKTSSVRSVNKAQSMSDLPKPDDIVQNSVELVEEQNTIVENAMSIEEPLKNIKVDDTNFLNIQFLKTVASNNEQLLVKEEVASKVADALVSSETVPIIAKHNEVEHSNFTDNSSCKNDTISKDLKIADTALSETISPEQKKPADELISKSKNTLKEPLQSPLAITENNSVQSSVDLNMECESVQSVESIISHEESISVIKGDSDLINSNSIIDISSDSNCSGKKDRMSLSFNLTSINNNKKASDKRTDKLDNKTFSLISSDDDNSSVSYVNSVTDLEIVPYTNQCKDKTTAVEEIDKVVNTSISTKVQPESISVPDSDSSNTKVENKTALLPFKEAVIIDQLSSGDNMSLNQLEINRVEKTSDSVKNSALTLTRIKTSDVSLSGVSKKSELPIGSQKESISEPMEVCEDLNLINNANEEINEDLNDLEGQEKNEPITLRIFKDNNALHSESRESPKRPRLDDSPKQLEFTLKISKDASTNIPKATMSPKRTQSPQRLPDPVLPRISSEVSITPLVNSPSITDKKTVMRNSRQGRPASPTLDPPIEIPPTKCENRVPAVTPHVNSIPEIVKTDLNNCNSVSDSGESSIIEIKNEIPFCMDTPVNISVRGGKRGRKEVNPTPGPPRRRGRPPKRPVEIVRTPPFDGSLEFGSDGTPGTPSDHNSGRPVRECRDRTKPILVKQRKPRGGGNSRGRGGGRGGARIPFLPGREALSIREQEELARIEARNQQIRLEKLAKREAKLAKKAKKFGSDYDEPLPPPIPLRELTEEEKAELAAKKEAEQKARAEAAAKAAAEAERLAAETAARKEAEKLAKVAARKERLRELHRMKREKILAKKAAKKIKDEERRKRKAAEKAAEQAAALQSMYEDETRMSAPDGSLRPLYGDDTPNRNKTGRMEINLSESKEVSVEQLAEYQWDGGELYMIQEQVAEYLGVKSFKRKYPDLKRRPVDAEERKFLEDTCLVPKSLCDLGITAVSSAEVLDIMFQDFPDKYEEVRKYLREKQMKEISSKQRALSLYSKQSDKAKADLREQALECAATWNAHLNRERREERKCSMDLQSFIIHYPLSKRDGMKQPPTLPGNYPVAVLPGQFCDYYKRYTSNELMYFPLNTVLYGPLKPNERRIFQSDASQSESEESSSSSQSSSSSDESDTESEADEDTKCKICNSSKTSRADEGGGFTVPSPASPSFNKPEIFLPCSKCKLLCHPSCCKITSVMLPHVRKYNWVCLTCKYCAKCNSTDNQSKMRLCDLCQRGFHITCLDARKMVPEGNRWHCAICSFCWNCNAREPGGPSNQWLHEFIKDENGDKVYQRSLCATCCANVGREAAAAVAAAAVASSSGPSRTSNIVTTSGTIVPGSSGMVISSSAGTPPAVRGYQIIQTKDGGQVRMAVSRGGMASMVVRPGGGRGQDSPIVARCPTPTGAPTSVLVRPGHRPCTESQVVVRTPTGVITRPPQRHNLIVSPNNRIEAVSPLSSGATNTPKK